MKYSICLECVFLDRPFHERIGEAARLGFEAVEFWTTDHHFDGHGLQPIKKDLNAIAAEAQAHGVEISVFGANSVDGSFGGSLVRPDEKQIFLDRLAEQIELAHGLECQKLIVLTGNERDGVLQEAQFDAVLETLAEAAELAEREDVMLVLEPLNLLVDHPGYFLGSSSMGFELIRRVGSPKLRLLYDIYHMQVAEGNLIATIRENMALIGHFHSAGCPGRHEHFIGEIYYPNILREIIASSYQGTFGLEYFPILESAQSLIQVKAHLDEARKQVNDG